MVCSKIVQLQGATGVSADMVNGWYEPTTELSNNVSVYRKIGDGDRWVEYVDGCWYVKSTKSRGEAAGMVHARIYPAVALEDVPMDCWEVYVDDDEWVAQASFSVSVSSLEAFQEYELTQVVHICIYVIHKGSVYM